VTLYLATALKTLFKIYTTHGTVMNVLISETLQGLMLVDTQIIS